MCYSLKDHSPLNHIIITIVIVIILYVDITRNILREDARAHTIHDTRLPNVTTLT